MIIKYVKQKDIDKTKWDNCILNSVNCMIYAMSWYLDIVCENWDALISDDYESVMPLPWKSKLGIKYIYHPFFAQQLGLFFQKHADDQVYEFLQKIPIAFLRYETSINYLNQVKKISLNIRKNHVLSISKNYKELYCAFSENTKRNIKKGEKNNPLISENIPLKDFIELKRSANISNLSDSQLNRLSCLLDTLIEKKHAQIIGCLKNDTLIAAAIFVNFKGRIIYLISASNESGKNSRAMFAVVNYIIKKNAGSPKLLDFEGSMIEGIARFFKGFGAIPESYYRVKKSRIPFIK